MKKILVSLLLTVTQVFAEDEYQEVSSHVKSWKDNMMGHWDGLSDMHKMIIGGVVVLAIVWVVSRMFNCGGCDGNCKCHNKK